jgi:molybdate transport system substrate-binding protein
LLAALSAVLACWLGIAGSAVAQVRPVTIFAAASLQTALDEVVAAWRLETGGEAVVSYAASSALARQIEQGAPADLFISADVAWMAYLSERGAIDAATRTDILANRLVLVAAVGTAEPVAIAPGLDLTALLGNGRLAIAETAAVPAGRYARAALEALGLWAGVADRLAPAENVRAALAFVARGETPLGIVYATDAAADPAVEAIGTFPAESHPPIVYPAALTAEASEEAAPFMAYLRSATAVCIFIAQGFDVIAEGTALPPPAACLTSEG